MTEILRFGKPVHLVGVPPQAGEPARDFTVHSFTPETGLVPVTLADLPAKPRLISAVPSLDTSVCSKKTVTLTIGWPTSATRSPPTRSASTSPFAQARWCGAEVSRDEDTLGLETRSFGTAGVCWSARRSSSRVPIFVLDADGTVIYTQIVPEITHEPEYEPVLAVLEQAVR